MDIDMRIEQMRQELEGKAKNPGLIDILGIPEEIMANVYRGTKS